jgi:hypothetical protein
VQFNASSVPVLQISLSSYSLSEQQLYDYGIYRVRQQLAPVPGVTLPTPAGGKYRQIMVDIDPDKLLAKGLTPLDVVNAVNAQNLTAPSGTAKIGKTQYTVLTNAMPKTIADLNNIPIKVVNGATVFVKDVGQVRDGSAVQQNIVREDGRRSVLLSVIKNGNASTLDVVNGGAALASACGSAEGTKSKNCSSIGVREELGRAVVRGCDRGRAYCADDVLFLGSALDAGRRFRSRSHLNLGRCGCISSVKRSTMTLGGWHRGRHPSRRLHGDDRNTHRLLTRRAPLPEATLHAPPASLRRWSRRRHQLRFHLGGLSKDQQNSCSRRSGSRSCSQCWPRMAFPHVDPDYHRLVAKRRAPRPARQRFLQRLRATRGSSGFERMRGASRAAHPPYCTAGPSYRSSSF